MDYGKCEECGSSWIYTTHPMGDMLTCSKCNVGWDAEDVIAELEQELAALRNEIAEAMQKYHATVTHPAINEPVRQGDVLVQDLITALNKEESDGGR